MLYLTRKIGESIVINDDIELTVVDVRGKSIKLGLTFPSNVSVYRREVYDRIQAEKAAEADTDQIVEPSKAKPPSRKAIGGAPAGARWLTARPNTPWRTILCGSTTSALAEVRPSATCDQLRPERGK